MKKFLLATTLAIATNTAFGAASTRALQIVGGATPTATNIARAGTMRTQTMKTSSISTPASVTTTPSIATPVSPETTDARLSLFKGIKGFTTSKIKDTSTTQQDLNTIDSRINELQNQLDQVETAQSTVLTEDAINAIIDERLSQLGTSTGVNNTYNKTEIDELLSNITKKLPIIDGKGNINIPDSDGTNVIQFLPYYLYANYWQYDRLAHIQVYKLRTPHRFGTTPFNDLAQQYTSGWVSDICEPEQSNPDLIACGFWTASGGNGQMEAFNTISCYKGFHIQDSSSIDGVIKARYTTFENMSESQIREHLCGDLSNDACSVSELEDKTMGVCTRKTFTLTKSTNPTTPQQPPYYLCGTIVNFGGLWQISQYCLGSSGWGMSYLTGWVTDICSSPQENLISCILGGYWGDMTSMNDGFTVQRCFEGFYQSDMQVIDQGTRYDYVTFEDLTESEIREHFCGTLPNSECTVSNYESIGGNIGCVPKTFTITMINPTPEPEYYFNYTSGSHGNLMGGNALTYLQHFRTNAPLDSTAIDNFVSSYCAGREPFWCGKNSVQVTDWGTHYLKIKERFHGYVLRSVDTSDIGTYSVYNTNEDEPATYINTEICGNPNGTDNCYVVNVRDLSLENPELIPPAGGTISDRYHVTVFTSSGHEETPPTPYVTH